MLGPAGSVLKAVGTLAGRKTIQLRWQSTHLGHQPSQTRQEAMGRQMAPMHLAQVRSTQVQQIPISCYFNTKDTFSHKTS